MSALVNEFEVFKSLSAEEKVNYMEKLYLERGMHAKEMAEYMGLSGTYPLYDEIRKLKKVPEFYERLSVFIKFKQKNNGKEKLHTSKTIDRSKESEVSDEDETTSTALALINKPDIEFFLSGNIPIDILNKLNFNNQKDIFGVFVCYSASILPEFLELTGSFKYKSSESRFLENKMVVVIFK